MVDPENGTGFTSDGIEALRLVSTVSWHTIEPSGRTDKIQVALRTWHRNLTAWLYVPLGIIIILLACFGIDSLIGMSTVSFPASVACLIFLFLGLILCDLVLGDKKTRAIVKVIDIPVRNLSWTQGLSFLYVLSRLDFLCDI